LLVPPAEVIATMRNADAGFVGFNPNRNWFVLLIPLPSERAVVDQHVLWQHRR
jgi:hypothetical protein